MDKKTTTSRLSPDKLARLWDMGSDKDLDTVAETPDQNPAELLRDRLAQKFPLDQVVAQILPKTLAQVCAALQPFAGNSYGVLINDPGTDIAILERIKDNAKRRAQHVGNDTEYDVNTAIYYAAIASALVYHSKRITSFSQDHLLSKYRALLRYPWLTRELRELFQEAERICVQKDDSGTRDPT